MTRVVHTSPTTGYPPDHFAGEGGPECLTCHPPAFAAASFSMSDDEARELRRGYETILEAYTAVHAKWVESADRIGAADRLADAVATLDSKTVVLDEYRSWLPEVKTLLDALAAYRNTASAPRSESGQ